MARASICIEMIFNEVDFYERPARAAELGFSAIEFWGAGDKDLSRLKNICDESDVEVAAFLGPAGVNFVEKEKPEDVIDAMKDAVKAARELNTDTLIVTVGNEQPGISKEQQMRNIIENLELCAPIAEKAGLKLAIEALNTLVDHQGYFLDRTIDGVTLVEEVGSPAVGLLYDIYHMQIMEGNLIETIRRNVSDFNHVHVADVPGRHEPGTGEINYRNVFQALDEAGYTGYCGFEFKPLDNSDDALACARKACGLG
ncbi:MAG: TIM barrel protein [Planctomycetes bacterium]|nr:TIM barrel protein [Planctomycetota bacterium]